MGSNKFKQIGIPNIKECLNPIEITFEEKVVSITCGFNNSFILLSK